MEASSTPDMKIAAVGPLVDLLKKTKQLQAERFFQDQELTTSFLILDLG